MRTQEHGNQLACSESGRRGFYPASAKLVALLVLLGCWLVILSCWLGGGAGAEPSQAAVGDNAASLLQVAAVPETESGKRDVLDTACKLIYHGEFGAAAELAKQPQQADKPQLTLLARIAEHYDVIAGRRQSARVASYAEQLAELEKLKVAHFAEPNSVELGRPQDANTAADPNAPADANQPPSVTEVLAAISKASEFANDSQRGQLLADPFVQGIFQEAVEKAAQYELQGKWLDAYADCYFWLYAIDPNNAGYEKYADTLIEKASIAAACQDSPCETRRERFEGVEEDILVRAVEALHLHYINSIDYAKMAKKAVKRSEMLAEVLALSARDVNDPAESIEPPKPEEVAAWSQALAGLVDEVDSGLEKFGKREFLQLFKTILAVDRTTVKLPQEALIAQFADAALSALDPYTNLVWPKQVEEFEKLMMNEFTGIGIEITKEKGLLTVASLLPGTPAHRAGLDAEDVIDQVDGVPTKDMSLMCAIKRITGPEGTNVTLTIKRPGEETSRVITITRAKIIVPTIRGWQRSETGDWLYMIDQDNKIGYVRITSFASDTPSDFEQVLADLEARDVQGLILDLRFNSGGLLESAVRVADKFIRQGLIVKTQPKLGMIPSFEMARKRETHPDYPLVVLINAHSASASEIVAGALADDVHDRAILVGERTHGKGSVQGITRYPGGGAQLKYTMAYYHLPSGQRVKSREEVEEGGTKDWGVGPDVVVRMRNDEVRKMVDIQRDNDVLAQTDGGQARSHLKKHSVAETLDADPQLAVGLLVLKAKLIEQGKPVAMLN